MSDAVSLLQISTFGIATIGVLSFATWLASLVRHDVSLVDRVWSVLIASAGLAYAFELRPLNARAVCMLALALVWAGRLSLFITWRNWGHGEDRRYQVIRARNEPHFGLKSLYLVFGLQAFLAWIVSAPLLVGLSSSAALGGLDVCGLALAVVGVVFEGVGDAQMARFKSDPANRGRVMSSGLWRYTRHPNYFGEACVWWGLWLMALSAGGLSGAWCVVSPLLMNFLLVKVSGVKLLEKDIGERRPAYREYIANTNAFIPGPPRGGPLS